MSAKDQMRAMLDQLMGTTRDGNYKRMSTSIVFWVIYLVLFYKLHLFFLGEESRLNIKFTDPSVCKSFLLGCCPHEILASTVSIV